MARQKKDIDNKEWYELCAWIETNIYNYDPEQKLQKHACIALRGLQRGKDFGSNAKPDNGLYPINVILMTFKAYKLEIQNAMRGKNFDSETARMQYVCSIVSDKINDVYTRYLNAQKTKEKVEAYDSSVITNEGAKYQSSSENKKKNKRLEELW